MAVRARRRSWLRVSAGALTTALLDVVYPPRCAACGEALSATADEPFCALCADAVEPVPGGCTRCGLPGPGPVCGPCFADPPPFTACHAAALLGGPVADAIHALKYRDRPALARPLGTWLAGRVPVAPGAAIVPVPLAPGRRRARGYDQAALLARWLVRSLEGRVALLPGALARTRETPHQVGRTRDERLASVRGAFRASPAVHGRDVVLVDDVVTTGATASACADALLRRGARTVSVVALARAD